MPASDDNEVLVRLSKKQAIVLFEFLSRFTERNSLGIEDQAEERVLWDVCADLEKKLPEPLRRDYLALLSDARSAIRDEKG